MSEWRKLERRSSWDEKFQGEVVAFGLNAHQLKWLAFGLAAVFFLNFALAPLLSYIGSSGENDVPDFPNEPIQRMAVEIRILRDGRLYITERITAWSEGVGIKRGLIRQRPGAYLDASGGSTPLEYTEQSQMMIDSSGRNTALPAPALLTHANGVGFVVGLEEGSLPVGSHTFVVQYVVNNLGPILKQNGRLLWKVSDRWPFPVNKTELIVKLPDYAPVELVRGWAHVIKNPQAQDQTSLWEAVSQTPGRALDLRAADKSPDPQEQRRQIASAQLTYGEPIKPGEELILDLRLPVEYIIIGGKN